MKVSLLLWPDTFEDWYGPLGIDRATYLDRYEGEWSVTVARTLQRAGVDVHLVFATLESPATAPHRPSGATVHFVRASSAYRAFRQAVWGHRWWKHAEPLWRVAPVLSTLSPRLLRRVADADVCIVQDYESMRFDVAAPILRALGRRVVALDVGGSARPMDHALHRLALRTAHRLLAVSPVAATRVTHPDVRVWPVPVRSDVFVPGDRAAARAELGIDDDAPLVVSVGRLHPVKGLHDLADACAGLECDLVLAGAGPEHDALAARRQPRLHLPGWVSPAEAARWYAAADVVALASRQEGQPIAVLEAFACGRGVVATAVGGVPDVVVPGRTGWLVEPRDPDALHGALENALADRATTDRYGETGRALVLERHSLEAAGTALLELLTPPGVLTVR